MKMDGGRLKVLKQGEEKKTYFFRGNELTEKTHAHWYHMSCLLIGKAFT